MSLAANALATFAEAKSRFGYLDDEQTSVEDLINEASSRMEAYSRRKFAARDFTFILDGTGRDRLVLPEYPINTVAKLTIDSARAFGAECDIASTDYQILAEAGMLRLYSGSFGETDEAGIIRVQCNAGFATTNGNYPALRSACLSLVDWLKSRAKPGAIGRKGEYSADRVSVSFEIEMPMDVRSILDREPFVRIRI